VWGNWDIKTAEKLKERIFKPVTTMGNHLAWWLDTFPKYLFRLVYG
jgi:hypothetical protein